MAVSFIFVFILGEALPLFRPATGSARGTVGLAAVPSRRGRTAAPRGDRAWAKPLVIGIDEYQMYFYEVLGDGRTVFFKAADGSFAKQLSPASMAGRRHRGAPEA